MQISSVISAAMVFHIFCSFRRVFFLFNRENGSADVACGTRGMAPGQIERMKLFVNGVRSLFLILQPRGSVLHHCIIICDNQCAFFFFFDGGLEKKALDDIRYVFGGKLSWSCKKVPFSCLESHRKSEYLVQTIPVISKCRFPVFAELCLLSVKDSNLRNVAAL